MSIQKGLKRNMSNLSPQAQAVIIGYLTQGAKMMLEVLQQSQGVRLEFDEGIDAEEILKVLTQTIKEKVEA